MTISVDHIPCDMTVTTDTSHTIAALQTILAKGGQWLPIDPPSPGTTTVLELLARNLSGPRRFGYGTIRDYVIGMKIRLADGQEIKCGGKVVKNVAGYDLQKLFIGADNTLGAIVEATFKLRPRPECEAMIARRCESLSEASSTIERIIDSPMTPAILDLHAVNATAPVVVLGFDGTREEVDWQITRASELGVAEPANLEYEKTFWESAPQSIQKISVLPSKLIAAVEQYGGTRFVARAGNGILYYHGEPPSQENQLPRHLWQLTKSAFDPKNLLASLAS